MEFSKQIAPEAKVTRCSADYHPSIWGDRFLLYSENCLEVDVGMGQRLEALKERVRNKLVGNFDNSSQQLNFIDAIHHLGVAYHFKNDIDTTLHKVYETTSHSVQYKAIDDLYTVSLLFRLLRQQGYPVASDMFRQFTDSIGEFNETLINDARGMLSLYEAAYFRVGGEDILDKALVFTKKQLSYALPNLTNPLKEQVTHALKQPIRTGLTRLEARAYMTFYEQDDTHDKVLLEFAKLDFNLLQNMHQKELSEITRWWKDLDFARTLPFARDRVVECYFWIVGVYFEPQYVFSRMVLTKVIAMASTIDDIYDNYGTFEELELFTYAIQRWDIRAVDHLPEYMKIAYQALLDVYNIIEEDQHIDGSSHTHYAKVAMKKLVKAYFEESKWYRDNYVPTFEEYMKNGIASSGYPMLATTCFVVEDNYLVTKEAIEWVSSDPLISRASSLIARLMDDVVSHKFEQKRGHVASAVECYMEQHGASEEQAILEFEKQITNAWKEINEECLLPTMVPRPILMRIDNLAKVIDVLYKDEDGYTNSGTKVKGFITSVLIDSVAI